MMSLDYLNMAIHTITLFAHVRTWTDSASNIEINRVALSNVYKSFRCPVTWSINLTGPTRSLESESTGAAHLPGPIPNTVVEPA